MDLAIIRHGIGSSETNITRTTPLWLLYIFQLLQDIYKTEQSIENAVGLQLVAK